MYIKNTIKVTIPFSFKGVEHSPSAIVDLDLIVLGGQTLDSLFQLVANENRIDNYSYEYEVLESSPKFFSEPTGLAVDFLSDSKFNLEGYKEQLSQEGVIDKGADKVIQDIASRVLNIDNLEEGNQMINQALLEAYQAGSKQQK